MTSVKFKCPECGAILIFGFAKCDYHCPNPECRTYYSEHEINLHYGEEASEND